MIHVSVDARDFLRAVRAGRVYRAFTGAVIQAGGDHGGQKKRADGAYRRALAAGWVTAAPAPETRRYALTADGEAALAAREARTP